MTRTLEVLAREAVDGSFEALGALCDALQSPVFGLCLRMLGDVRDAEDAAQDVLIKVITNLGSFEGRSLLSTWVHRIAVRHVLTVHASRAELRAVDEQQMASMLEAGLAFGAITPSQPAPDDRVLAREIRLTCTQGMLLMLSRDERLAVVLIDVLGFDAAEAADIAEVTHDAMRQRITRGRATLANFLRAQCGIANPEAACTCDAQVTARRAVGLRADKVRFSPLVVPSPPTQNRTEATRAVAELRNVHTILHVYQADAQVSAPATLRQRLRDALPTLLRG